MRPGPMVTPNVMCGLVGVAGPGSAGRHSPMPGKRLLACLTVVVLGLTVTSAAADPPSAPSGDCGFDVGRAALARSDDAAVQPVGTTHLISVASTGGVGNLGSVDSALSDDGAFVPFYSYASDLVAGDTNGETDIFLRDRNGQFTTKVSQAPGGGQADDGSVAPVITPDGRFVAFHSHATNLVPGDTNGREDVFFFDRSTSSTTLVSQSMSGGSANGQSWSPSMSVDGHYVAYSSSANDIVPGDIGFTRDIFVWDRTTDETILVSRGRNGKPANNSSFSPDISGDGRYVTFSSRAKNLVPGPRDRLHHIYLYDRELDKIVRVDQKPNGIPGNRDSSSEPTISGDGSTVAFGSKARNLSRDDSNYYYDVFSYDVGTGLLELITHAYDGGPANGEGYFDDATVSADGRYVAFDSDATNLVPDDGTTWGDAFVYDRTTDTATLISRTRDGQANRSVFEPMISDDARFVTYYTYASNLFDGDDNECTDVFIYRVS